MEVKSIIRDNVSEFDSALDYRIRTGWKVINITHTRNEEGKIIHIASIKRSYIEEFSTEELIEETERRMVNRKIEAVDEDEVELPCVILRERKE